MKQKESKFVGICSTGLEHILEQEIIACGGKVDASSRNTVEFYADKTIVYKLNMSSRVGLRFMKFLDTFFFRNADDIYKRINRIDWNAYFSCAKTLKISVTGKSKYIDNNHFLTLRIKDGIVDYFRDTTGERPSIEKREPEIQVSVYINESKALVYLDSTGIPLFKRGYRAKHAEAPIKEDLAAGILLLAGYDGSMPFLDPMCGGGTFLFEAYCIARKIAVNRERMFSFMHWHDYDEALHDAISEELLQEECPLQHEILGYEKDARTAMLANHIKKDFFFDKKIKIMTGDFRAIHENFSEHCIVTNPPYGERVKTDVEINEFYKSIGDFFKQKCKGSTAFVFTANLPAAKHVGLRTSARIELWNGPLEARLLKYSLY